MFLRSIARKHVKGEVSAADIEKDVKRKLSIDLTGKLAELQAPMDKSKAIYDRVRERLRTTDGFQELLEVCQRNGTPTSPRRRMNLIPSTSRRRKRSRG